MCIAVDAAERKVAEAAARISESFPGLAVETAVAAGSAPLVLERNCSDAALLVLATRQQNAVRQWIGRSVTNRVTGRVRCPVVSLPLASA